MSAETHKNLNRTFEANPFADPKDLEFEIFKEVESRLLQRCAKLEKEITALKAQPPVSTAVLPTPAPRAAIDLAPFQKTITELNTTIEKYRTLASAQAEEIQALKRTELALRAEREAFAATLEEAAMLRELCAAQEEMNRLREIEDQRVRTQQEKIEKYADYLKKYAVTLNEEKEWMRRSARELLSEVEGAHSLHPLKDYLALTLRELAKIELELMKTPTSSPQRKTLEDYVDQLLEQREFLKQVLASSESEIRAEAARVFKILQAGPTSPVPPLLDLNRNLLKP